MSKRDLKKYLTTLNQEQIAEQLLSLYDKFADVKSYYDFVFNPNEDKLSRDAKTKISAEYFPIKTKRAKLRRSVAQKIIKKYQLLGVDPIVLIDIMLYNIEVAQKYFANREVRFTSFYKSMLNAFEQTLQFSFETGNTTQYMGRFERISLEAARQKWPNQFLFDDLLHKFQV